MINSLTVWVRKALADVNDRIRELFRRQVRKLIELILTDIDLMARLRDVETTAIFEEKCLRGAAGFRSRTALHREMVKEIRHKDGLFLEFGVYRGDSINRFAELVPDVIWYGFELVRGVAGGMDFRSEGGGVQHRREIAIRS